MTEERQINSIKHGTPWTNNSFHTSFQEANEKRTLLLSIWEEDDFHKGMQVKVKFMLSKNQFVVKTRLHPDFTKPQKGKKKYAKRGKRKNKNSLTKRENDSQKTN